MNEKQLMLRETVNAVTTRMIDANTEVVDADAYRSVARHAMQLLGDAPSTTEVSSIRSELERVRELIWNISMRIRNL